MNKHRAVERSAFVHLRFAGIVLARAAKREREQSLNPSSLFAAQTNLQPLRLSASLVPHLIRRYGTKGFTILK
jgi:hypothetical protein